MKKQNTPKNHNNKSIKNSAKAETWPDKATSHHDKLFKRFYSHTPFAVEIVRLTLSKEEIQKCDLSKLKVEKSLFKDKRMDLILSFPLKGLPKSKIRMVILFEHKSKYDKNLFKQILRYQIYLYEQSKQTIAVLPVLFYHGKAPWNWELSFQEAILGEFFVKIPRSIRKNMLNCGLRLLNTRDKKLQRVFNDKSFKTGPVLRLLDRVWLLKNNERELRETLFGFFKLFSAEEWILAVAKYLKSAGVSLKAWDKLEKEALKKGLLKKGGYMDIREEIRMEGRIEGRQEGWQKGQQEGWQKGQQEGWQKGLQAVVRNMLKNNLDMSLICKVTGLSEKEINKLKNGS